MNLFLLDLDHKKNAEYHADNHVGKMAVEISQMLASTLYMYMLDIRSPWDLKPKKKDSPEIIKQKEAIRKRLLVLCNDFPRKDSEGNTKPYGVAHPNHPCTKWMKESMTNITFSIDLGIALTDEWKRRYGRTRDHASKAKLEWFRKKFKEYEFIIPDKGLTRFALAIPIDIKESYPNYHNSSNWKAQAIDAYRDVYRISKRNILKWNRQNPPSWF